MSAPRGHGRALVALAMGAVLVVCIVLGAWAWVLYSAGALK